METVLSRLLNGAEPSFPGIHDPPFRTPPFCGILIPPTLRAEVVKSSVFEAIAAGDEQKYQEAQSKTLRSRSSSSSSWNCWLCGARNIRESAACVHCKRERLPSWLQAVNERSFEVGSLVNLRRKGENLFGMVVQIDFLHQELHIYLLQSSELDVDEVPVKKEPVMYKVPAEEVVRGRLILLDEEAEVCERITDRFCNYFLCGKCGLVSQVDNGRAIRLTDLELQDKEGRLRSLRTDLERKRNEVRYLTRKWRESKTGYERMAKASGELKEMKRKDRVLAREISKPEYWCPFCAWEWPEHYPYHINQSK